MYGDKQPKTVRNFWLDAKVDGHDTSIGTGPRAKDGGFEVTVKIRDAGKARDALSIRGYADADGTLHLWAKDEATGDMLRVVTVR